MSETSALTPHFIKKYGWIPDLPDRRDHRFAAAHPTLAALPPKVDLTGQCPVIYDQGQLGSCTGNAIAGAVQFDRKKQNFTPDFIPSRLFIYYNERVIEHTTSQDSGAMIRDGIKSISKLGVCPETDWGYDIAQFARKPPAKAYRDALNYKAMTYSRVDQDLQQMRGCLAEGYPFVFGFSVYQSFESQEVANTGTVPMPASGEQMVGGHAVVAVGYDDSQQRFIVRNSWGETWGDKGYCTMPYAYLTDSNLADDLWTVRVMAH